MANNELLDQLWYTWSKDGLGSMSAGYRVRAASPGLYNLQDMRYRRVDRFLRYELPQGVNSSEFTGRIAPISLSFVDNGDEQLLIRKVFVGRDYAGRNSVFFTHLIAGLPREFTARDAIRLWYCPELWVESEDGKGSNDTTLPTIPYSRIRAYVEQPQTSFNFTPISEQLQNILSVILSQGLPAHLYARGQSLFTAALIYGITHCLPMTLLKGLTFTTYESNIDEMEVKIVGTISGAELQDATMLQIQPAAPSGPLSQDMQTYVVTAFNRLLNGDMKKLTNLIDEVEKHSYATTDDLLEQFKRRFRIGPLTPKQLEDIVRHPDDNIEELLDPSMQQESAALLLKEPAYWKTKGKSVFTTVVSWMDPGTRPPLSQQTQHALATFINAVALYVIDALQTALLQFRDNDWTTLNHSGDILLTLAPPKKSPQIWDRMLTEFAQGQIYARITSDALWNFQVWLLQCAKLMQPLPTTQHMQPWLSIPSWEKLDKVLKLDLPTEWERLAMFRRIENDTPKSAVQVVQAYDKKFKELLLQLLQQGSQLPKPEYIDMVVHFFAAMVEHNYPDRVSLLLVLLNAFPEPRFVDALFASVRFATPHQLVATEIESVLAGCHSKVIAACGSSPALRQHIQEYILSLTPNQLSNENVERLLTQLSSERSLPEHIENLVSHWLIINTFQRLNEIDRTSLKNVRQAFQHLLPATQAEPGINQQQNFQQAAQYQLESNRRKIFAVEMIPFLVKKVEMGHDLENVKEILGPFLADSPWELFHRMAVVAGSMYAQHPSRLTPYLLYGIREYARNRYSQEVLDAYLQALYGNASDNALKNVDAAVSAGVWPELVQREWKGWRERGKTHWGANIPVVNKFIPQPQKTPTGPQPQQPAFQQNASLASPALPRADNAQMQPYQQQGVQQVHSAPPQPQQARPLWQHSAGTQAGQVSTPQMQYIVFHVDERKYEITASKYQRLRHTFVQMLPYWSQILAAKLIAIRRSKSLTYEVDRTASLLVELRELPTKDLSKKLVEYLQDDVLIRHEVDRLLTAGNLPAVNFLNPEDKIPAHRSDFQHVVGDTVYFELYQKYTEEIINEALGILIRRYHFIQHLDERKKDWKKWLRDERKDANVENFELIQR